MAVPAGLTENGAPIEFHLFPRLPTELRLKIWAATITPRIIEVSFNHDMLPNRQQLADNVDCIPKYISTAPSLLHINHESRTEGLRHYEISNSDDLAINRFYFNPSMDIIDIRRAYRSQRRYFFGQNGCGLMNEIQRLAMPMLWFVDPRTRISILGHLQLHCPALREVTIIAEDPRCHRLSGPNRDVCYKRSCQTESLIEYEELTNVAKLERKDAWWYYASTQDRRSSARKALESSWRTVTALPCPSVRSVAICSFSKRWDPLPAEEVDRFVAARALEDLSLNMRWLFT